MFRKTINFKDRNIVFVALALVLLTIGCQKDDICPGSTPTTPLIKVLFMDVDNPTASKSVVNLKVKAINVENALIDRSTTSKIEIPLNTNANSTEYEFTEYAAASDGQTSEQNPPNTDLVSITYARNQVYINRACGYKVLYEDVKAQVGNTASDATENWIKQITVTDSLVENETITYINIYH